MSAIVPYLGTIGMGAATVVDAASNLAQSRAQAENYRRNAEHAQAETKNKIAQEREKYRKQGESQRAQFAASGITLDSGTVLDTLAATDADAAMAAANTQYEGDRQAESWAHRARTTAIKGATHVGTNVLGGAKRIGLTR